MLGFVKGIGQGIIGTVTKPPAGIFDCLSTTTFGISHLVAKKSGKHLTKRARSPIPFYKDKILRVYNEQEA